MVAVPLVRGSGLAILASEITALVGPPTPNPFELPQTLPGLPFTFLLGFCLISIVLLYWGRNSGWAMAIPWASVSFLSILMLMLPLTGTRLKPAWLFLLGVSATLGALKEVATSLGWQRWKAFAHSGGALLAVCVVLVAIVGANASHALQATIVGSVRALLMVSFICFLLMSLLCVPVAAFWRWWSRPSDLDAATQKHNEDNDEKAGLIFSITFFSLILLMFVLTWVEVGIGALGS